MSFFGRLHARNEYQKSATIARAVGCDPDTAKLIGDLIAARIRAEFPRCTYLAHEADCATCGAARVAEVCAGIAEQTGGLR